MKTVIRVSVIGLLLCISIPFSGYGQDRVAYWLERADSLRQTKNYSEELGYRQKIVEARPHERLRDYYYLMFTFRRLDRIKEASEIYEEMKTIWPDQFKRFPPAFSHSPHYYWMEINPYRMEDPEYLSEQIYVLELTPDEELQEDQLSHLKSLYILLVLALVRQEPDGFVNCETLEPWLTRALIFAPESEFLVPIKSYCEEEY